MIECESMLDFSEKNDGSGRTGAPLPADLHRIVTFDPRVETTLPDFLTSEPDAPDPLRNTPEVLGFEVGAQIDRDVVATGGGVI